MRIFRLPVLLGLLLMSAAAARAENWPTRPIRFVVAFDAGGTVDIVARVVGDRLSKDLGQPVVIENRPGAAGNIAGEYVSHATADGYTFLVSGQPTHSVGPHLFKNLNYNPMRDVPPVAMLAVSPNLLVVNAKLPVKSVADLVKLAKEKPGTVTYSSAGIGTSGFLAGEMLAHKADLKITHIPYRGGGAAVNGLLSGNVDFMFFTIPALLPHVKSGDLRALAIAGKDRSPLVPDVPTIAEAGYPGFDVNAWYGLFAAHGTPQPIVDKISAAIGKILAEKDVQERFAKLGAEPHYLGPKALTDYINVESPSFEPLLKDISINLPGKK
ncbi:MAG TPA: tripartite tricarboxylate transporter substrate binding protein [Pseudolabrys sp.]|nr:tripartite tricarboxylate transporter substrate binding protein [Pseudolabrys sp.]